MPQDGKEKKLLITYQINTNVLSLYIALWQRTLKKLRTLKKIFKVR